MMAIHLGRKEIACDDNAGGGKSLARAEREEFCAPAALKQKPRLDLQFAFERRKRYFHFHCMIPTPERVLSIKT